MNAAEPSPDDLIATIRDLEMQSSSIEPDAATRQALLAKIGDYSDEFLDSVYQQPGFRETPDMGAGLERHPIGEAPESLDTLIDLYRENVDFPGSHPTAPGHLAYIPACSNYYSALGDYLAAVSNRFSGNFFAGPGAVRMENLVLSWMMELIGYPQTAAGNLTSGGSIANLTSIITARESHGLKSKDYPSAVVYVSEHTHHSIDKALHIAGMGESVIHKVALDDIGRMQPDNLASAIEADRRAGLNPWLVVASVGTTNLGSIDPLVPLGDLARDNDCWFHADAAYGGFIVLSDLVRDKFEGMSEADSVVLDPHKTLYIPFGTGAVVVRDGRKLYAAHHHTADYMQDAEMGLEQRNPADFGPELSRPFRALRVWLPLKLLGLAPFRAALTEKVLLSRYAYQRLNELDGFEMGPFPELSIFVFRAVPPTGDPNTFNERLVEAIRRDGRVFFSSTMVNGNYMIRFPLLSFRGHLNTVDLAIEIIREKAAELTKI